MPHSTESGPPSGDGSAQQQLEPAAENSRDQDQDQDADYDNVMRQLLGNGDIDLGNINDGTEQEKAEDAMDFEDIGDDDLAEDEDDLGHDLLNNGAGLPTDLDADTTRFEDDTIDDLFGDNAPADDVPDDDLDALFGDRETTPADVSNENGTSSATEGKQVASFESTTVADSSFDLTQQRGTQQGAEDAPSSETEHDDIEDDPQWQLQKRLLEGAGGPVEVDEDVFAALFPAYQPDRPLRWHELLGPRKSYYIGKTPLKPPKPVQPTKVTLELQADQEKKFKLPATTQASYDVQFATAEERGFVLTADRPGKDDVREEDETLEALADDEDDLERYTWADIVAACQSFDIATPPPSDKASVEGRSDDGFDILGEDAMDLDQQEVPRKRNHDTYRLENPVVDELLNAYIDDPEAATAHLAKRVRLDLNDPYLLVDIKPVVEKAQNTRRLGTTFKRDATGGLTREFKRRYDISNDAAYENLKRNHHGKVRAHLGGHDIEHSLPAAKLQYPFYKVKLTNREARSFHRPALNFPYTANNYIVKQLKRLKRRDFKGKPASEIFVTSGDLSLSDNSSALFLEYSEEYPFMLSGFGMGSKLVNHYRRRDKDDTTRPKHELGETNILMPEDKSPFSVFGEVEPGETVPTITNQMYRAPIFKHEPNETDFIAVCSRTGVSGRVWTLRKVENLHVVAQEFPLQEVPGTHSRKVTDAAKKRLRMLAWRMLKKYGKVKNEPLLKHLPHTDLAQNRSKMREIMSYDKDKGWVPKQGEAVPDASTIRSWLSPEEICLLDSMQVGNQQLEDTGYNKAGSDDESENEDETAGQSLDQQLAPWNVTKNFLNACQGKAMVAVVGEGDPSGRGEAFSFIRTSMKGGFKDPEESIDKKLDSKRRKEASGHQYNVAEQARAYGDAIARTWQAQKASLSSTAIPDEDEGDEMDVDSDVRPNGHSRLPSMAGGLSRTEDDTASFFSKMSSSSQTGKVMKIVRTYTDKHTGEQRTLEEIVHDPKVWREYQKRRALRTVQEHGIDSLRPTGNEEFDRTQKKVIEAELIRLKKNKSRTNARDRSKGIVPGGGTPGGDDDAADSPSAGVEGGGSAKRKKDAPTLRKCNNCGLVGHIRTNKKMCPMLNGTIKPNNAAGDSAFGSLNAGAGAASSPPASQP